MYMCGRYTYFSSKELLQQYEITNSPELQLALLMPDNYNVAPGTHMPVIIRGAQAYEIDLMLWGLVPNWSKTDTPNMKLINARAENLTEKQMWNRLLKSKRCVIPARGFYEWKRTEGHKQPYYIQPIKEEVFNFAGLWDEWHDSHGNMIKSYAIITTAPNTKMSKIHNRMPAILNKEQMDEWLSPKTLSDTQLRDLLAPALDNSIVINPVSLVVNNARVNTKELIYPLPAEPESV